ncbi:Lysine-arginine-ornithine-binding periplasmic protein precursor [Salmonella enterica subsp. arizonae]|uniref:Lysine-arginine-ornithine-binding periplasmic protein n=1 Tax=Salmonella enterica subsp. arizonae TaxID=59203 RepID=A0A2X4T888_SALER|nr:Lysine-arginine-ornithine-binding periplasmic protein precursor [Salmonella enterica subsp. arizonae]
MRKDDTELKAAFDKALAELREDGLTTKWPKSTSILMSTAIEIRGQRTVFGNYHGTKIDILHFFGA